MAPVSATAHPEGARERRAQRLTLIAMSLGFGVIQLDVSVVNVAIKPIGSALGGDVGTLQWVVNAYTITFAALILSAGAFADRVGARRVFLAGFALFAASSAACGLAPTVAALIGARAVQGIAAAMLAPSSLSLLNHAYDDQQARARAVSLWAAGASCALAGGPLIGGVLIQTLGWRAIFFINVPLAALGMVLTARHASETSRSPDRRVDLPGQALAVAGLGLLAAATIQGGRGGFTTAAPLAGFALAAAALIAFVLVEAHRGDDAMLPLGLFARPTFGAAAAIGLSINIAFYGLIFVFSLYFQQDRHLTALQTGLAFAPSTVAILGANLAAGRANARFGPRPIIATGALLMTIGAVALLGASDTTPYGALVVGLVVLGFGLGLVVPAMTAAILASVGRERSGIASGTLNTARQTGSVIGVALFGALTTGDLVAGLRTSLIISAFLTLAAFALSLRIQPST